MTCPEQTLCVYLCACGLPVFKRLPVLAFGGEEGSAPKMAETMKTVAQDVRGDVIPNCGHYIPEEAPDFLAKEMLAFFAEEKS
jgi:pimeloyl-ACP methyl ester carboxylesterase